MLLLSFEQEIKEASIGKLEQSLLAKGILDEFASPIVLISVLNGKHLGI